MLHTDDCKHGLIVGTCGVCKAYERARLAGWPDGRVDCGIAPEGAPVRRLSNAALAAAFPVPRKTCDLPAPFGERMESHDKALGLMAEVPATYIWERTEPRKVRQHAHRHTRSSNRRFA